MANIKDYPFLKKILEEMGFDQGAPADFYFPAFDAVMRGESESGKEYDLPRLEALAKYAAENPLSSVITLEEARAADNADYVNDEFMAETFLEQFVAGCGEINDVIATKGDWKYLDEFIVDVFQSPNRNPMFPEVDLSPDRKLH